MIVLIAVAVFVGIIAWNAGRDSGERETEKRYAAWFAEWRKMPR